MYESPEKITLALYFATKHVDRDGKFHYKSFPTLQHMQYEAFAFAYKYNFFKAYEYQQGEYTPLSLPIEQGIWDNFVYNPVFDNYESIVEYDLEFDTWMKKNPQYTAELKEIRTKCDRFTSKELYLIFYEQMKPYIKNIIKKNGDVLKNRNEISKTLGGMKYEWWDEVKITEEKYEKLRLLFDQII